MKSSSTCLLAVLSTAVFASETAIAGFVSYSTYASTVVSVDIDALSVAGVYYGGTFDWNRQQGSSASGDAFAGGGPSTGSGVGVATATTSIFGAASAQSPEDADAFASSYAIGSRAVTLYNANTFPVLVSFTFTAQGNSRATSQSSEPSYSEAYSVASVWHAYGDVRSNLLSYYSHAISSGQFGQAGPFPFGISNVAYVYLAPRYNFIIADAYSSGNANVAAPPVPEPTSMALAGFAGLAGLGGAIRRARRNKAVASTQAG